MGERDCGRYFPNVPIADSPMPSGPLLLQLNLGTCTLETGSRGPGNPPFFGSSPPFPHFPAWLYCKHFMEKQTLQSQVFGTHKLYHQTVVSWEK